MRHVVVVIAMAWLALCGVALVGLEQYDWGEYVWGGKGDDYAYVPVALSPLVVGLLVARRWAVLAVGATCVAVVLVEQALWRDDPELSGIDDMGPMMGIVLVPFPMLLAALGVVSSRWLRARSRRDRSAEFTPSQPT